MASCSRLIFSVLLAYFFSHSTSTEEIILDGDQMRNVLEALTEKSLHLNQIQQEIDGKQYKVSVTPDGQQILQNIVDYAIEPRLNRMADAVRNLRDSVEDTLDEAGGLLTKTANFEPHEECCNAKDLEEDLNFPDLEVNRRKLCVVGPGVHEASSKFPKKDKILEASQENLERIKELKWQFTAFEMNYVLNYPAADICWSGYAPTLRSWYKETASSVLDLVIVFDRSKSIRDLDVVKDAIKTIVNMLGPNDRVAIVRFNNEAETPQRSRDTGSECYSSQLARAVPENLEFLIKEFVDQTKTSGGSSYIPALRKAFSFFQPREEVKDDREYVMLFVSDGDPVESKEEILNTIRDENFRLNNDVVIHTFGYNIDNPELEDKAQVELLKDMSKQRNNNRTYETKEGQYNTVESKDLRETMARFYSNSAGSDVVFSVPYHDGFGFGMVISACLPVHQQGTTFIGVTCIDILMRDLIGELTSFSNLKGDVLYPFMLDKYGRYVYHPLLPQVTDTADPPVYLEFSALEPEPSVIEHVKNPMLRGESGSKEINVDFVTPRGSSARSGINEKLKTVVYTFKTVLNSGYSVCVVIGKNEQFKDLQTQSPIGKIYHHRTDVSPDRPSRCEFFERVVYKEPVVHLSPEAFKYPGTFYTLKEVDDPTVQYLENYLEGGNSNPKGILGRIRDTVTVFNDLYRRHISGNSEGSEYTVWRYIGTVDGVFITDHRMPSFYDHLDRSWYREIRAYKGHLTISEFYRDATTKKLVVTLGKTILVGRPNGDHSNLEDEQTMAVIAMDFTLPQMYYQLTTAYSECKSEEYKCMLINENGILILHTDFMDVKPENVDDIKETHITEKEYGISRELIKDGIMEYSACLNTKTIKNQNYWKIKMPSNQLKIFKPQFSIAKVSGTNVYIIIRRADYTGGIQCYCGANRDESQTATCLVDPETSVENEWCECPCFTQSREFDFCNYHLRPDKIREAPMPCVPDLPKYNFENVKSKEAGIISSLPKCHKLECEVPNQWACEGRYGCMWCKRNNKCTTSTECKDETDKGSTDEGTSFGVIGGIVAAVAVIVVAVIVIIVFVCRAKKQKSRAEMEMSPRSNRTTSEPDYVEPSGPNPGDKNAAPSANRPPAPTPRTPDIYDNNIRIPTVVNGQTDSAARVTVHPRPTNSHNMRTSSSYENVVNISRIPDDDSSIPGSPPTVINFQNI